MNKTITRLTYSFFFLLFLVIAPMLIFYSLGYRYNWVTKNIEKNGALYIKSYPRGAEIYIDQKKIKPKTPTQVVEISSGKYLVEVKKDKYVPWIKNLEIYSGVTTFAEDISLFLEDREKTILSAGGESWLINKQKSQYCFLDKENNLNVTDVDQSRSMVVYKFEEKYQLLDWSPNNQDILIKLNNAYYLFNLDQKTSKKLNIILPEKIKWDNNDSNVIWYQKNKKLYKHQLNILSSTDEIISATNNISDFDLNGDYILTLSANPTSYQVDQWRKSDWQKIRTTNNINLGLLKAWQAQDNLLIFSVGAQLFIAKENTETISIPHTVIDIHDERILLSNGYETILYNFKKDWRVLIDRSTKIVTDILWHPNGSYFLSESTDLTYLTEIDGRDKRNTITLLENPLKKMYLFNKKGDQLYILNSEENYYLTIQ